MISNLLESVRDLSLSNVLTILLNLGIVSVFVNQFFDRRKRRNELRVAALERATNMLCERIARVVALGEEINWAKIAGSPPDQNYDASVFNLLVEAREAARILQMSSFAVWARSQEKNILGEVVTICDRSLKRLGSLSRETRPDMPPVLDEFRASIEHQLARLTGQMRKSL